MTREKLAPVVRGRDRRASLEALADYLAEALDDTDSPRDQAPLASRLTDVLTQLDSLKKGVASDPDNLFGAAPEVGAPAQGSDS